jgi:ectoine hydroxylase-related dioxygenase (phytanoyl-CoA dioxygenase family)
MSNALASLLPTEDDIAFYEEHGWFVPDTVFSEEEIQDAVYGIRRFYAGERDRLMPIQHGYLDWKPSDGDVLRLNDYVSLQNDEITELVASRRLSAIAGTLARTSAIRLFHDQLIWKPSTAEPETTVGWHSDRAYWRTCTSENMLTAWVPFASTSPQGGTLMFLDGSHKWPGVEELATFGAQNHDSIEDRYTRLGYSVRRVPVKLRPGQASFHHCRLIHGSLPNSSTSPRIALAVHFQDQANRYTPAADERGAPLVHVNDVLCRPDDAGDPDYCDPDICPVLWMSPSQTGGYR